MVQCESLPLCISRFWHETTLYYAMNSDVNVTFIWRLVTFKLSNIFVFYAIRWQHSFGIHSLKTYIHRAHLTNKKKHINTKDKSITVKRYLSSFADLNLFTPLTSHLLTVGMNFYSTSRGLCKCWNILIFLQWNYSDRN